MSWQPSRKLVTICKITPRRVTVAVWYPRQGMTNNNWHTFTVYSRIISMRQCISTRGSIFQGNQSPTRRMKKQLNSQKCLQFSAHRGWLWLPVLSTLFGMCFRIWDTIVTLRNTSEDSYVTLNQAKELLGSIQMWCYYDASCDCVTSRSRIL